MTGRTLDDLKKGEPAAQIIQMVEDFMFQDGSTEDSRCIIGHNVVFDKNFLYALWNHHNKKFPATLFLDTKPMAKVWSKNLGVEKPKLTLGACLDRMKIPTTVKFGKLHDAGSDSRYTYFLYKKLIEEYQIDHLPYIKNYPHE